MGRGPLRTVLYVDDEPDIREVVEMSLSLSPELTVHACESGEQALREGPDLKPDLILLDVMMPNMDGPTTMQRMRALPELATTPVVFMTAKAMPAEVARFKELGAAAVIAKPFDPMRLAKDVEQIWKDLPNG